MESNKRYDSNRNQNNGNNNRPKNNKNKPQKKYKPDPMGNSRNMERTALRVIKDIAFGRFNYSEASSYFTNPQFVESAIKAVWEKLTKINICITAINIAYPGSTDPYIQTTLMEQSRAFAAWNTAMQSLSYIKASGCADLGFLSIMANNLPPQKHNM